MNKIILVTMGLLFLVVFTNAQPVINGGDLMGEPGTQIVYNTQSNPEVLSVGSSGANQTWDFSGMTTDLTEIQLYLDPASTPYAGSFPNANRCYMIQDATPVMYNYFQLTPTAYWTLGNGYELATIVYNNTKPMMNFPTEYQDEWDCVYTWDFMTSTIYDSTHFEVDGYGTIIDGVNSYSDVLRIKQHRTAITYVMSLPISTMSYWTYTWEDVGNGTVAAMSSELDETNPNFTFGYFARINTVTGIKELPPDPAIPTTVTLQPAYPNPFNPETLLRFTVPVAGNVVLKIFDLQGRVVETLYDAWLTPGSYQATFKGDSLAGGIYFAQLNAGNQIQMEKLVLIK